MNTEASEIVASTIGHVNITEQHRHRFFLKVKVGGVDECWLWEGRRLRGGYGQFDMGGGCQMAHRMAWVLKNGTIPTGEGFHGTCVLHKCDNPACVNPEHLFLGTHVDNMSDMVSKGRARGPVITPELREKIKLTRARGDAHHSKRHPERIPSGDKHWTKLFPEKIKNLPRGEANNQSKLTESKVREIRSKYANGGVFYRTLAAEYCVSEYSILKIVLRRTWKHVT